LYENRKISYRVTSLGWRKDPPQAAAIARTRADYALRMHALKQAGADFIYFDESSFNNWDVKKRVW
jgi:hypothetical protein